MKNFNEWLSTKVAKPLKHAGDPVESDTVLKIGDMVRIKDKEWFDSLNKDKDGDGLVTCEINNEDHTFFTKAMTKWLGKEIVIRKVFDNDWPCYIIALAENNKDIIEGYLFTNEMLEYI